MNMNGAPGPGRRFGVINRFREHIRNYFNWIIAYIISSLCYFGNIPYISARMLTVIDEIVDEFRRYYGNNAEVLKILLQDQYYLIGLLINSIKIGDAAAVDQIRNTIDTNVASVAEFFAGINPYWTVQDWLNIQKTFIEYVRSEEAVLLRAGLCTGRVTDPAALNDMIIITADYISNGLIKQFIL
jgi:hypothetical protein